MCMVWVSLEIGPVIYIYICNDFMIGNPGWLDRGNSGCYNDNKGGEGYSAMCFKHNSVQANQLIWEKE